jgi:hypothetical protein
MNPHMDVCNKEECSSSTSDDDVNKRGQYEDSLCHGKEEKKGSMSGLIIRQ